MGGYPVVSLQPGWSFIPYLSFQSWKWPLGSHPCRWMGWQWAQAFVHNFMGLVPKLFPLHSFPSTFWFPEDILFCSLARNSLLQLSLSGGQTLGRQTQKSNGVCLCTLGITAALKNEEGFPSSEFWLLHTTITNWYHYQLGCQKTGEKKEENSRGWPQLPELFNLFHTSCQN